MESAIGEIQDFVEAHLDLPDSEEAPWAQHAAALNGQLGTLSRILESFGWGFQDSLKAQRKTMENQFAQILDLQEVRLSISLC